MGEGDTWLEEWSERSRQAFSENQRIKSFDEFLEDLSSAPYSFSRNASQYLLDAMEFFGTEAGSALGQPIQHFRLFDAPFGKGSDQPLVGQEEPVLEIYEALKNLVQEGRADRMIHLHGPNGSAKSLIVELLMRACEEYSLQSEGALYTLHWVFPREGERTMGFGQEEEARGDGADSFAHLPPDQFESRVPCDLNDPPLFLIPVGERLPLLSRMLKGAPEGQGARFVSTHHILDGGLCPRCRQICDALLDDYEGDTVAVLRHVQVRRLFISRRYRRGAVVISPQETPDAASRQLTLDSSLSTLPPSLQHLNLDQLLGDLVDANNGLVEFSDFLTRSAELNKYLLSATERGEVCLPTANIYLNICLFATSNERNLDTFKETPDFPSFKGRMILVTVPYLLEKRKEAALYRTILARIGRFKHVSPHVGEAAAHWTVLTRLNRPNPEKYPPEARPLIGRLTPEEKALLYDGALPNRSERYTRRECQLLSDLLADIRGEYRDTPIFEGRFGASPREMREVLYNAAYRKGSPCLTIPDLLDELATFVKDRSLYLFLQIKVEEGYHDSAEFIETVRKEYLEGLDREVLAAMELVPEGEYEKGFERYLSNVRAWLRKEKVHNPATGGWDEVNMPLLEETEEAIGVRGDPKRHREDLLARVAAWSLENPGGQVDLSALFAPYIERVRERYRARSAQQMERIGRDLLLHGSSEFESLPEARRKSASETLDRLVSRFGYCQKCAPQAVGYLLENRYKEQ